LNKQIILEQVKNQLSHFGIPYAAEQNSGLTLYNEFVDTGWNTGEVRIIYEASIWLDEQIETAFMWEHIRQTGREPAAEREISRDDLLGSRKVRCVQYGPEGQSLGDALDLGAVSALVEASVTGNGWKFKQVLRREQAQYAGQDTGQKSESGQISAAASKTPSSRADPDTPVSAAVPAVQPKIAMADRIRRTLAFTSYGLLMVLVLVLFLVYRTDPIGWLIALPLYAVSCMFQFLVRKKGCVTGFVIYLLTAAAILIDFLILTAWPR
jgi:hypothetical protein